MSSIAAEDDDDDGATFRTCSWLDVACRDTAFNCCSRPMGAVAMSLLGLLVSTAVVRVDGDAEIDDFSPGKLNKVNSVDTRQTFRNV